MDGWERKLATRDTNRVVRPFEWGTDWLHKVGYPACPAEANGNAAGLRGRVCQRGAARFRPLLQLRQTYGLPAAGRPPDLYQSGAFPAYPENDQVPGLWFPAEKDKGRALVVLPQWNSDAQGHVGLAKLLNRFGISALRMTMAYHAERKPAELQRADYHVSSNVGRTIHACRQSAIDTRACVDWLVQQGYERIGILGTSLGSCVAFIATAHDPRVKVGIFNHVSMYFSDVVWTGLSTQNVRQGFGDIVSQEDLRRYLERDQPGELPGPAAGPRFAEPAGVGAARQHVPAGVLAAGAQELPREELPHQVFTLPCGHYTTGQFPFNLMDGLAMCRFAARNL